MRSIHNHFKKLSKPVIPKHIYMYWHTPDMPPRMKDSIDFTIRNSPGFTVHVFNEETARGYIKDNYDDSIVKAYDSLIPNAYKSDFFRYCILYKLGGIYLDIKLQPANNFKFDLLVDKEYFVFDNPIFYLNGVGLTNGLICVKPANPIMLECIQRIVNNIKTRNKGFNALYPTGPALLGECYLHFSNKLDFDLSYCTRGRRSISYRGEEIIKEYRGYREDICTYAGIYYVHAWHADKIYKEDINA